jgi:hypothetical protein
MIEASFPVSLFPSGDMDIEVEVTAAELELLAAAEDAGEEFCDAEALKELYGRVYEATYDEIANYIYDDQFVIDTYLGGKYDFEQARKYALSAYSISIGYPSVEEE